MLELQERTRISESSSWFFEDYSLRECFDRQLILSGQRMFPRTFLEFLTNTDSFDECGKNGDRELIEFFSWDANG